MLQIHLTKFWQSLLSTLEDDVRNYHGVPALIPISFGNIHRDIQFPR